MKDQHGHHYRLLAGMSVLSFLAMFVLMYAMVDVFDNVLVNINQVYMAALMTAPMVVIELAVMRQMYPDKRSNAWIAAGSALLLVGAFAAIRAQSGVSDRQFLRSMIPHHAGALLMCEKASLTNPEVIGLCESIRGSQQAEIAQMRSILERLP